MESFLIFLNVYCLILDIIYVELNNNYIVYDKILLVCV